MQKDLLITIVLFWFSHSFVNAQVTYGSQGNPTGNPIGGGSGYNSIYTSGHYTVNNLSELLTAIGQVSAGQVIYINAGASINMSNVATIEIPKNVTLAGNRGHSGSPGPLIYANQMQNGQYLLLVREGARVTGVRIKGPDQNFSQITYPVSPFTGSHSNAKGISIKGADVSIDNCEISNFHRVGIDMQKGTTRLNIHHNHLHDIHAYPIFVVNDTWMPNVIEANIIEWIWHAIAGTGAPGSGFEARYNNIITKPMPLSWYSEGSHAIDMHPDDDISSSRDDLVAADKIIVHHNSFIDQSGSHPTIVNIEDAKIRGVPRVIAHFFNNIFQNLPDSAVAYEGDPGNLWVHDNLYGPSQTYLGVAAPSTPQILFNSPAPPDTEIPVLSGELINIDFNVNVLPSLSITRIIVKLNDDIIYDGSVVPSPGSLNIIRNSLNQSLSYQELTIMATDNSGATGTHKTVFDVQNVGGGPANLEIQYDGLVPSQKSVKLTASESILLGPNFQVDLGGVLQGDICCY